jgi:hypothetical protein
VYTQINVIRQHTVIFETEDGKQGTLIERPASMMSVKLKMEARCSGLTFVSDSD